MKKIIATASALFLLVGITNAQSDTTQGKHHPHWGGNNGENQQWHGRPGPGGEGWGNRGEGGKGGWGQHRGGEWGMVHLSKEQIEQSKNIRETYGKQLAAFYDNDNLKLGDFKKKSAAIRKEMKDKLAAILTPEQKSKIEASKKKREENMQVMAAARLERMKIDLTLTDNQVASIKTAEASLHTQMKALHEDESLVPEQKREKMKALMEQHKATLKAILTPEQLNKLESTMKHREWRG